MRAFPVVAILVVLVAGCDAGAHPPATSDHSPSSGENVEQSAHASSTDGVFRLDLDLPHATWSTSDAITGTATLSMVAPGTARIGAPGAGPIAFGFVEVDGVRRMGPAYRPSCAMFTVSHDAPITQALARSGGWSDDDPDATFYAEFFHDPEIHLSPGAWDVSAVATFAEGGCGGDARLTATVRVEVTR